MTNVFDGGTLQVIKHLKPVRKRSNPDGSAKRAAGGGIAAGEDRANGLTRAARKATSSVRRQTAAVIPAERMTVRAKWAHVANLGGTAEVVATPVPWKHGAGVFLSFLFGFPLGEAVGAADG